MKFRKAKDCSRFPLIFLLEIGSTCWQMCPWASKYIHERWTGKEKFSNCFSMFIDTWKSLLNLMMGCEGVLNKAKISEIRVGNLILKGGFEAFPGKTGSTKGKRWKVFWLKVKFRWNWDENLKSSSDLSRCYFNGLGFSRKTHERFHSKSKYFSTFIQ